MKSLPISNIQLQKSDFIENYFFKEKKKGKKMHKRN